MITVKHLKNTGVLVDTILYNPMFAVLETTENSVTVYDFFNQKLKVLKLKADKRGGISILE